MGLSLNLLFLQLNLRLLKRRGLCQKKMCNFSIAVKISKVKSHCASESINSWVCTNSVVSDKKLQAISLVVQWLRLRSQCKGPCSNTGQGTRSSMTQLRCEEIRRKEKGKVWSWCRASECVLLPVRRRW